MRTTHRLDIPSGNSTWQWRIPVFDYQRVPGGMHVHHAESQSPPGCFGHPFSFKQDICYYIMKSHHLLFWACIITYFIPLSFVCHPCFLTALCHEPLRQRSRSSHEPRRLSLMRWSGGWWWPPAIVAWAPIQRPWSYMKIFTNRIPMTLSAWDIWSPFARTARFSALDDCDFKSIFLD